MGSFIKCLDVYCSVPMRKNTEPDDETYTLDQLYLAGLIYTDGTLKDPNEILRGYTFYQSDVELMEYLSELGLQSSISGPNKGCYSRYVNFSYLGKASELIYSGNRKKLNLEKLSALSYRQFMRFLSGLLDGDGCKTNGVGFSLCNFNGDLDTLQELCQWNGIFCTRTQSTLRFIDICFEDLTVQKKSRWQNQQESSFSRVSKQKSEQTRFKKLGDVYWVKVRSVEYIGTSTQMTDIETDTHYFVSRGVTTHNCNDFDMPYIFARLRTVLGKKMGYKLSPVGIAYLHRFTQTMRIAGISLLDYMELYKKFIGKDQPSFSLGYIGQEEVEIGKTVFKGSLVQLYKQDLNRYVEYNLNDVKIVVALDKKLDFIHLARSVCHKGHVPYEWYMYSSRWIDGALLTYLHRNKLIAPNRPEGGRETYETMKEEGAEGFEGAYVKDPVPGLYDWVYSSDVTSLYPSVIMSLNISPETKVGKIENWDTEKFVNGQVGAVKIGEVQYTAEQFKELIKDGCMSISSNGVLYKQPVKKIVGKILP